MATSDSNRGFSAVLTNAPFRSLWGAQLLAQSSQNAINFVQLVLIEQLTGSAMLQGLVILAFTLPGVIFSPIAGVVVDRFSKKSVLVISNFGRVFFTLCYVFALTALHGTWELIAIYLISFLNASLAQFFYPAEAATIPALVGNDKLLTANSLFNLTMTVAQVVGMLVLGPLVSFLFNVRVGFLILAVLTLGAAVLVSRLPHDSAVSHERVDGVLRWLAVWHEAVEGWRFVSGQPVVKVATAFMVTINTLVMVLAMVMPGFAARVLGMAAQSAVIVFVPAFAGMLLATALVGRWGRWLRRVGAVYLGLALVGVAFAALGFASLDYQRLMQPILRVYPHLTFSLVSVTMVLGFIIGLSLSAVNILSQTAMQEESPSHMRGRVFSVLFMLNALVGIPPMLALGEVADRIGIPRVLVIVGVVTILIAGLSFADRRVNGLVQWVKVNGQAFLRRPMTTTPPPGPAQPPVVRQSPSEANGRDGTHALVEEREETKESS